jgi:phosphohistidine phosphatase SixA
MRILFLRHGEKSGNGDGDPLTARGREMARSAGAWMRDQGLRPSAFQRTKTVRTRETAELALESAGFTGVRDLGPGSLPNQPDAWKARVTWVRSQGVAEDALVLLVGHDKTQQLIENRLGIRLVEHIPKTNRAGAYLVEQDDKGEWKVTRKYDGTPTARAGD